MGRGPKPAKSRTKPAAARKSPKNEDPRVRDLEKRLAEALRDKAEALKREAEALEQQTATSEILRVISSSPTDAQPVFEAIVRSAVRLCNGVFAAAFRFDGSLIHFMAGHGYTPEAGELERQRFPATPNRERLTGRAILDRTVVQLEDASADTQTPRAQRMARVLGYRGIVSVPMLREGVPVGLINVARRERGPFPLHQVDLVRAFADQAVIAIENVRLFNETKEALERQTATAEILRVISGSPTDTQPVFEAIARNAARLCDASRSSVNLIEGDWIQFVARYLSGGGGWLRRRHAHVGLVGRGSRCRCGRYNR
jgi:two-component system, NtrC family, sensor kinase